MLYLKYSRDWKRNADVAVAEVCDGASPDGPRRILIVPEQNSFDAEWRLCAAGGDGISRCAEVLSFTRLATRIFSEVGGAAAAVLDQSGRMIALAGALEQLRAKLKLYGAQISKPEFLKQLLQVVDEFHGWGLHAKDVRAAREKLDGSLSDKLEELCLILETYEAVCEHAAQDPSTRLDRLRDAIYDSEYARHTKIVVEGFSDFTAQEMEVLNALLQQADQMTVYLTCDSLGLGQSVFSVPRKTAHRLQDLAKRNGIYCRTAGLLEPVEETPLNLLRDQLFAPRIQPWREQTDRVTLVSARSPAEESAAMVGTIQQWIFSGSRYREIAVAYTDENLYGPMVENLLERYEIPAYFAGDRELLRQPMIRGVLFALEAAACGMEAESVSEYLKSGYAPITADAADRLENYGFVWHLRGSGWEKPFDRDPDGLQKDEFVDEALLARRLSALNEARALAIGPVTELRRDLREAKNTGEQVRALAQFLNAIAVGSVLDEKTASLAGEGRFQEAQTLSQLYELLLSTMEQIYGVLGRTVREPDDFYRFFRAALTQNAVGTVPATVDCVRVGNLSSVRNLRVQNLLILGASDGLLPAFSGSSGLLSDGERRKMKEAGLSVAPDDNERMDRELLTAFAALTAPTERLFVSAAADSPSYLFTRLQRTFPACRTDASAPLPVRFDQAVAYAAARPREQREALLRAFPALAAQTGEIVDRAAYTPGRLSDDAVSAIYGPRLSLTSSRVDKFASCKYAYFLRYGLNVREQKPAEVDASLYGVFVHYVLEHTVEAVQDEGGFHKVSLERTLSLAECFCERFVTERLGGLEEYSQRGAYLFRRNFREVLAVVRGLYSELSQSEFVPTSFELAFENETAIPITGDLAVGSLRGVVDRVDLYTTAAGRTYLRVIDYKTGRKDFDYTDLLEGVGLQMLLYLFALTREAEHFYHRPLLPAGVLYFPARYDVETTKGRPTPEEAEKEHRKAQRRKGLLLDDEEILHAMEPGDDPIYLPYKFVRKDESRIGDLADSDQMRTLERFVFQRLGKLADGIACGEIEADPYWRGDEHNACRWCEYKEICHTESGEIPLRRRRAVSTEQFWQTVEQEVQEHG